MDQNSKPLITTIIPTCNRPLFLLRALKSVLSQTFPNFIVCIYDNSSNDDTQNLVKAQFPNDKRVQYHKHKENIGATANFAFGLNAVNTAFFSFLADDDVLLPNFFETALNSLAEYPEAGFFCGSVILATEKGKIMNVSTQTWPERELYLPPQGLMQMIGKHLDWIGVLFRKEVRDKIGSIDTRVKAIDVDYLYRAAAKFSYVVSKTPCGGFFQHSHSYSYYAGVKVIWPSYLYIIDNLKSTLTDTDYEINYIEHLLKEDLRKKLLFFMVHDLIRKDFLDCCRAIDIFRNQFQSPFIVTTMKMFLVLFQKLPFLVIFLKIVLSFRKMLKKNKRGLQKKFGAYLHSYLEFNKIIQCQ